MNFINHWENGNPDYHKVIEERLERIKFLVENPEYQYAAFEYYRDKPAEWINDLAVTYNPRNKSPLPKIMPFLLFPRQREFVDFVYELVDSGENGLVEKSRDVGATWLAAAISAHMWIYDHGCSIGFGSRKEMLVDRIGDPDSIFEKIRMVLDNLPDFFLPKGYSRKNATYMKIINSDSGATIKGESGSSIGRGGRSKVYWKDESAHYEQAELIEAALGDNTDTQIDISSVNGTNNAFYRRRMAGEVWHKGHKIPKGVTRVFIMDWRDHPLKDETWYNARRAKAEAEGLLHIFKQEVDRDYAGSQDRIIIPQEWVKAAIDAHIKLGFPAEGQKIAGSDVADEGGDKNALSIRHGVVLTYSDCWGGSAGDSARECVPICIEHGVDSLQYDSIGVGAGFKEAINNMRENGKNIPFRINPWNAGEKPLDPDEHIILGDSQSPTNAEQYQNIKAQAWFRLRARFYKTYMAITEGENHPYDELISLSSEIPKLQQLVLELSQAQYKTSTTGKTLVDKKPDGATSPNMADAMVMAYTPNVEVSILDVL